MSKLNYLNIGCGLKYHPDWLNADLIPSGPGIEKIDILKTLPFEDNKFDVIYHSQVLEHLPVQHSSGFIKECFRILKPGGIIRVVVPDLENIVNEYKKWLIEANVTGSKLAAANYEWSMLELFDQSVRDAWGGQMAEYLVRENIENEDYVIARSGFVARTLRQQVKDSSLNPVIRTAPSFLRRIYRKTKAGFRFLVRKISEPRELFLKSFLTKTEYSHLRTGRFRNSGEIHYWMYDKYSLKKLLVENGFEKVTICDPYTSLIPDWGKYNLDVSKEGIAYDPTSLFAEALKV